MFWISCLLVLYSVSAFAQSQTTGRISGTVKDPDGAVIVGAEVTVKSLATSEERKVTTDTEGNYAALLLSPGTYRVSVTAYGFKRAEIESVRVVITESTTVDVSLEVGTISEQAVINASGPLIQYRRPATGPRRRLARGRGAAARHAQLPTDSRALAGHFR